MTRAAKKSAKKSSGPRTKSDPELPPGESAGPVFAVYDHTLLRYITRPLPYDEAETFFNLYDGGHRVTIEQV